MEDTDKQLRFVDEILVDGYGSRAAIRAGYSPKGATALASNMLKDPDMAIAVFKAAGGAAAGRRESPASACRACW